MRLYSYFGTAAPPGSGHRFVKARRWPASEQQKRRSAFMSVSPERGMQSLSCTHAAAIDQSLVCDGGPYQPRPAANRSREGVPTRSVVGGGGSCVIPLPSSLVLLGIASIRRSAGVEAGQRPADDEVGCRRQPSKGPPLPEYPRPQLVRKRWQNLNGLWQFAFAKDEGSRRRSARNSTGAILVPFPVESALSGVMKHGRARLVSAHVHRAEGMGRPARAAALRRRRLGGDGLRQRQEDRQPPRRLRSVLLRHHRRLEEGRRRRK